MSAAGMRPPRANRTRHTHPCAVPDCKGRVPCSATPIIDEYDDNGHVVSGHMSCEDNGPVEDQLCDDCADLVPCVYCGAYGHDVDCCEDQKYAESALQASVQADKGVRV